MELTEADIQPQLTRRRPGQSKLSTPRKEADIVSIQSGTEFGKTLGSPISLFVKNKDQRPGDYKEMSQTPRPSHADFTYIAKYGTKSSSGGGRSSARETIGRVAAGSIAEKWLKQQYGLEIVAWVSAVGEEEELPDSVDMDTITRDMVDSHNPIRCGTGEAVDRFSKVIEDCKEKKDSIGGVVTCVVRNVPVGLGEPCFDKLEAKIAHAMLSIPATKGFEIGSGFAGTKMNGSVHNDPFVRKGGRLGTKTNRSGGIQGGISNGENIYFRVAFKPPATIGCEQNTATYSGDDSKLAAKGRHDPCVVPRAISIVETMTALVLADAAMCQLARSASIAHSPEEADVPELRRRLQAEIKQREQYEAKKAEVAEQAAAIAAAGVKPSGPSSSSMILAAVVFGATAAAVATLLRRV